MFTYNRQLTSYKNLDDPTIDFFIKNKIIDFPIGLAYVKDRNHRYLAVNKNFCDYAGMSIDRIIGATDDYMPWADVAHIFISKEIETMNESSTTTIEQLTGANTDLMISKRKAIYDVSRSIKGVMTLSLPISEFNTANFFILKNIPHEVICYDYPVKFTKKESVVLYFLSNGLKRSRVSEVTGMSTNSFDFHIKNIKIKINAKSILEVIDFGKVNNMNKKIPFIMSI
ncbi:hypothetical protein HH682_15025 [Rosenbergiella sp. S61]|uniref:HTH luxR-type domain-containing protein n=1 Tax=Rosenbergiella gaditana TaxID=2726987 RepID=A0ABS5T3X6_9GAMM|nr:LuxR C-terminal-related transcriptional regulator [Rosenbergiella gaditana]MBT0725698.1 hypothetical protein [Rosenbergiella gaditana]